MNIGVIGGDLRTIRLAQMYAKEENMIYTYGLDRYFSEKNLNDDNNIQIEEHNKNIIICDNIKKAIDESEIVISGMPFSKDGVYVNAPYAKEKIKIEELLKELEHKTFFAGGIPKKFEGNAIKCFDLLQCEELTILNAIPTVEGTIKIVIEEREETIFESNVLICGYGRIGKILCKVFKNLGANVYCAARKEADLAWIREGKYVPLRYDEICEYAPKINIVINTVPSLVITKKELDTFNEDVLIVDVASNPGGIDKEYATSKNIKVITALGIPGKEFPKTAAKFIKEAMLQFTVC